MSKKKCSRGPECSFAHSDAELRYWFHERVASNPRLKPPDHVKATHFKLCNSVLEEAYSYCKYGTFCSFPHSKEELESWNSYGKEVSRTSKPRKLRKKSSTANVIRPRPKLSSPPQKYILCAFYSKSNHCKQGNRCHYAHSIEELHTWNRELLR